MKNQRTYLQLALIALIISLCASLGCDAMVSRLVDRAAERAARTRARAEEVVALVDVITSFEAWDLLVRTHGRSRRQIRTMWIETLERVLATTPYSAPPIRPEISGA
jgi:hypothetical protein